MEEYVWQPKDGITITLQIDGEEISVNGTLKSEDVGWDEVRTKEINKALFSEYTPETGSQEDLKEGILKAIEAGLDDFKVFIQFIDGKARNAYELDDWAKGYSHRNLKLGSPNHYYLSLAWQIQTGKKTWKQLCDENDMSEAFRVLKDDDGTFFVAGGCKYFIIEYPEDDSPDVEYTESDVVENGNPEARCFLRVAFVVLS